MNDAPLEMDRLDLVKSLTPSGKINSKKFDKILKDFIKKNANKE